MRSRIEREFDRAALGAAVLRDFASSRRDLHRLTLPAAVAKATTVGITARRWTAPRLCAAVDRVLLGRPFRAQGLVRALVLFRLLKRQGLDANLVIGLPEAGDTHDAHAWVEIDSKVAGPYPGRHGHTELVRYP